MTHSCIVLALLCALLVSPLLASPYILAEADCAPKHSFLGSLKIVSHGLAREISAGIKVRRSAQQDFSWWQQHENFSYHGHETHGLYVFIHGLNGHPAAWEPYLTLLHSQENPPLIWVPHVPLRGNCPEESAIAPLLAALSTYLQRFPGQPVILVGSSLGSRLASYLEYALRPQKSRIAIFSLAGVHFGSKRVVFRRPFTDPDLYESLRFAGGRSQLLLQQLREKLPSDVERRYTFYASSHDSQVVPFTSGLPLLGLGERHFMVEGVDHCGIIPALADEVIYQAEQWRLGTTRVRDFYPTKGLQEIHAKHSDLLPSVDGQTGSGEPTF